MALGFIKKIFTFGKDTAPEQKPEAEATQEQLREVRKAVEKHTMMPALKVILAERYRHADWKVIRAPLMQMGEAEQKELLAEPAVRKLLEPVSA